MTELDDSITTGRAASIVFRSIRTRMSVLLRLEQKHLLLLVLEKHDRVLVLLDGRQRCLLVIMVEQAELLVHFERSIA